MAANRRRRIAALTTAVAAVGPIVGLTTGCEGADTSLDCGADHRTIADSLKAMREAGLDAARDPSRTGGSIATIRENPARIDAANDGAGSDEADRAVKDLDRAISDYDRAVLNGEKPGSGKVDAAADELRDVCTS
ncbi:hypothetical protein ABZT03_07725 [Streptomyces sp. NPDC005574]|uniref:hypothetical protein n=1 Tax=Streptomyces sp. NPDC005574 TaxID=3156891 RepID=UPI0033A3DEFA